MKTKITILSVLTLMLISTLTFSQTKVWVATVSQTGTGVPTFTVLKNTFGETFTYSRTQAGRFNIVSPNSSFVADSVTLQVSNAIGCNLNVLLSRTNDSTLTFQVGSTNGTTQDGKLWLGANTTLIITKY